MIKLRHKLVQDIESRFEQFSLNTVIAGFMEYNNKFMEIAKKEGGIDLETVKTMNILLAPFAPHMGEEVWELLGEKDSVFHAKWPEFDENAARDDEIEIPVQINGKTKVTINVSASAVKDDVVAKGKEALEAAGKLNGNIVKEIYVPGKILNIVVK